MRDVCFTYLTWFDLTSTDYFDGYMYNMFLLFLIALDFFFYFLSIFTWFCVKNPKTHKK